MVQVLLTSQRDVTTLNSEVNEISTELGTPIGVDRSLAKELVFVSGGSLRGLQLLKAVSSAVHASVVSRTGGLIVERTKQDRDELRKRRLAIRSKWIGDQIAQLQVFRSERLKNRSLMPAYSAELSTEREAMRKYAQHAGPFPYTYFAQQLLPSETLLESLVTRMGPQTLAATPTGEARVYEDSPVDGAQPLPLHQDLLDLYVRDSYPLQNAELPEASDPNSRYFGMPGVRPAKLRLTVFSGLTTMTFSMEGYDASGKQVVAAMFSTFEHNPNKGPVTVAAETMADPQAHWTEVRESAEGVLTSCVPGKFGLASPELLLRPDKHEPLNLFASDVLRGIADEKPDRTTIVCLSDEFWSLAKIVHRNGRMCVTALAKILDQCEDYESIEGPSDVIWRPKDPEFVDSQTADRRVLARTARAILDQKGDLFRQIAIGYHDASSQADTFVEQWFSFARWLTDLRVSALPPVSVCRLLGAVSDADWDAMLAGQTINLGGETRSELWNVLACDALTPAGRPFDGDIERHALELFDRGGINDMRLSLRTTTSLVVRSWIGTEDLKSWGDIGSIINDGPGHSVSFQTPPAQWGRPEFNVLMGGQRLFRYGAAVDRLAVFALPYGFHSDFACRAGYTDVSEPSGFTDLPQGIQDAAFREWQRQRDASALSMHPSEPSQNQSVTIPPEQS